MSVATSEIKSLDAVESSNRSGSYLQNQAVRRYAVVAAMLLIAYFIGFAPAWLKVHRYESQMSELQRQTQIASVRLALADAALSADRGDFEEARRESVDFFTRLRAELDRDNSALSVDHRRILKDMLGQRDELIGQLARREASGATVLSSWYFELAKMQ
jgi:hypothetical protein